MIAWTFPHQNQEHATRKPVYSQGTLFTKSAATKGSLARPLIRCIKTPRRAVRGDRASITAICGCNAAVYSNSKSFPICNRNTHHALLLTSHTINTGDVACVALLLDSQPSQHWRSQHQRRRSTDITTDTMGGTTTAGAMARTSAFPSGLEDHMLLRVAGSFEPKRFVPMAP